MTGERRYTVACLAGDNVGPELMAEASRAIGAVSRLHGFGVDELHLPFGREALSRCGHPLPASTRTAYLDADAVLIAAPWEPALRAVLSELDLQASVTWARSVSHFELTLFTPLADDAKAWTVRRAFAVARSSRGRVASVGDDSAWRELVDDVAREHDGVSIEHIALADGLGALAFEPNQFDVVVGLPAFAEALAAVAGSSTEGRRVLAAGRLAGDGPSIFVPAQGAAREIAGQGVANPRSMLLAAALMLGEGLGEHDAAETLATAVMGASGNGVWTPDMLTTGVGATTREFADVVLAKLPWAFTNAEFMREAWA